MASPTAAKIIDFIAEQKLDEFDLIGHSFGGGVALMIALDFMKRRPGSVSSLILLDSLALPQRLPGFIMVANIPKIGPAVLPLLPARLMVGAVLRSVFHDRRRITEEAIDIYARNLATKERRHALPETTRHIIPDDVLRLVERYHRLKQPNSLDLGQARQDYSALDRDSAQHADRGIETDHDRRLRPCAPGRKSEIAMPAIRDWRPVKRRRPRPAAGGNHPAAAIASAPGGSLGNSAKRAMSA